MAVFTGVHFLITIYARLTTGSCPRYEPLEDFSAEDFTGVWYEMERDVNFRPSSGDCVTAQYELRDGQDGVSVTNNEVVDGERNFIEGYALVSSFFPGQLGVFFGGDFGASYRVVDTDYTDYAIIYSCEQLGPFAYDLSWLLTRSRIEETDAAYTTLHDTVDPIYDEKLPDYERATLMQVTDQGSDCTYYTV